MVYGDQPGCNGLGGAGQGSRSRFGRVSWFGSLPGPAGGAARTGVTDLAGAPPRPEASHGRSAARGDGAAPPSGEAGPGAGTQLTRPARSRRLRQTRGSPRKWS
jgi:hypothetical protein